MAASSIALAVLVVALWGGNPVAVSFSVEALPPVAVAFVRFLMGTAVMYVWCRVEGTRLRLNAWEGRASLVAGTLLFAQIASFNVGVLWTNSTHGAMLINTFPFFVALIEQWITRADRLSVRRVIGLIVATVGVVFVVSDKADMAADMQRFLVGDAVLLVSSLLLAMRVVYVGRVVRTMQPSKLIFWNDVVAVVMFAVCSLSTESFGDVDLTTTAVLGLLYQGLVVAGVCFVVHASLLRHHSASQISAFSFATPVFGVFFAVLLRDEPFTLAVALGACCVAFGIWAVSLEQNRRRAVR